MGLGMLAEEGKEKEREEGVGGVMVCGGGGAVGSSPPERSEAAPHPSLALFHTAMGPSRSPETSLGFTAESRVEE